MGMVEQMRKGDKRTRTTKLNLAIGQLEALAVIADFGDGQASASSLVRQAVSEFIESRAARNIDLAARLATVAERRVIPLERVSRVPRATAKAPGNG